MRKEIHKALDKGWIKEVKSHFIGPIHISKLEFTRHTHFRLLKEGADHFIRKMKERRVYEITTNICVHIQNLWSYGLDIYGHSPAMRIRSFWPQNMLKPNSNRKGNPSTALPQPDDVNFNRLVRTASERRRQLTKENASFSDVIEIHEKGIRKLAVVVGVSNTHVHVHHVVEDGDRNPDTDVDVDVDVDVAAAVAAGDIPPTITTYEILTTKPDRVEKKFYKKSHELQYAFKVEAFDQLKFNNRIFLSIKTEPTNFVRHGGKLTSAVLNDVSKSWKVSD